jgi:hypothetical protein
MIRHVGRASVKRILEECIIIGGKASGFHVLGKSRDRNYKPNLSVVREIIDGIEVVYMHDEHTNYLEGMNEKGIGIVNAALLVSEDEKAADAYWKLSKKKKGSSKDGPRVFHALAQPALSKCIKSLVSYEDGIKGHTFVGNPTSLYSIEMTSKHNPIINKLDPATGFDVRTNHGEEHAGAGYTPDGFPEDYLSSKIRKATAQIELVDVDDPEELMPALAYQPFEPASNMNMLRRTGDMRTSSQIMMNLNELEFILYVFQNEGNFHGLVDKTPDDYDPKINVRVIEYRDE